LTLLEADWAAAVDAGETPTYLDRYPIADYPGVWDRVSALVDGIEGVDYIFDRIEYAKPDLDKWLPGYKDFWSWTVEEDNPYSWDNLVIAGPTAVPTYAAEWQTKINQLVTEQIASLGSDTSGDD